MVTSDAWPDRIERPGGWYHLTARGNERRPIFRDDRDRQHFCQLLAEMVDRFHVRLHGYVLMDNHYHLILELREANLSRASRLLYTNRVLDKRSVSRADTTQATGCN